MSHNQNGLSNTKLYRVYRGMISRCYKKYDKFYKDYGGRGIIICDEWLGSNGFLCFYDWAMENGYSEGLSIERKNVNGNYCPENCCWITMKEQQRNKRNNVLVKYNGEELLLSDVAKKTGLTENAIKYRIKNDIDIHSPKHNRNKFVERDDGEIYHSIREAAIKNGVHESRIGAVCRGLRKRTSGHSFVFLTKDEAEKKLKEMERDCNDKN